MIVCHTCKLITHSIPFQSKPKSFLHVYTYFAEFEPGLMNKELHGVTEWFSLGANLGLSKDDLDAIRHKVGREDVMQCRLETLAMWYNNCPDVSWSDLIKALVLTCRVRLAHKLALKYSESIHHIVHCDLKYSGYTV